MPAPSEIQKKILFAGTGSAVADEVAAKSVIERFATRAFRRPVQGEEVQGLLKLYRSSRSQGETFEQATKLALTGVLVSPHFLFRIELDPTDKPGEAHALSDYELATRLSYFLWSSMPDDELFKLAAEGKLHQPTVLGAQVKRMLADPKSTELISNFAGQWLEL